MTEPAMQDSRPATLITISCSRAPLNRILEVFQEQLVGQLS